MSNEIARIGTGGCLESLTNGSLGQVLAIGAAGPEWTTVADDQTATEVPFAPYSNLTSTNVQSAIQELIDEICTLIGGCSINALSDVDTVTNSPTTGQSALFWTGTNWEPGAAIKQVANPGSTPPIALVADAGAQPLWNTAANDVSAETNDIVPVISSSGERHWYIRHKAASVSGHSAQVFAPNAFSNVVWQSIVRFDGGWTNNAATGAFIAPVDGWVLATGYIHINNSAANDAANAPFDYQISISISGFSGNRVNHYANQTNGTVINVTGVAYVTAGTAIAINIFHNAPGNISLVGDPFTYFSVAYVGG